MALLVFLLLATAVFVYPRASSIATGGEPQRRRRAPGRTGRTPAQPQTTRRPRVDYSQFEHDDAHVKYNEAKRANCNTCHKLESPLQYDIKDFPDHPACVSCHRQQFFTSARPVICTVCHKASSPRDSRRFDFPKPAENVTREFPGRFPHGLHQSLLARARPAQDSPGDLSFVRATFAASAADERRQENCALCHQSYDMTKKGEERFFPAAKWPDNMLAGVGTFRKIPDGPEGHRTCFVCHASDEKGWKSPSPVAEDCAGCHSRTEPGGQTVTTQPGASSSLMSSARPIQPPVKVAFTNALLPARKVLTFQHEGGGSGSSHLEGCTTCHINITQEQTLIVKPDVPISSCAICHVDGGKKSSLKKGTDTTITSEMEAWLSSKKACLSCHTMEIGSRPPPCSHYYADRRVPPPGLQCR